MKQYFIGLILLTTYACHGQSELRMVGGPCEGCEALLEYGDQTLSRSDTLPYFKTTSTRLILTGTVYQEDGRTPANGIIIYAYHTDEEGIYVKPQSPKGWEDRHGYLRGWVLTDEEGKYTFYTNRPASYPNTQIPQHVHLTVKESDTNPYYIDSVHFLDDPALSESEKSGMKNRGGSGLVMPEKISTDTWVATRDIILGKNIPNY